VLKKRAQTKSWTLTVYTCERIGIAGLSEQREQLKHVVDELKVFIHRNLALINLAISAGSLASYEVTMYLLVYWTN
jgi:ATP-dependent helicase/DNAse subunit B